ncbi:MAG: zinc-ribbon domain-containing protein, partial [Deltaproteobacteria bacterium]
MVISCNSCGARFRFDRSLIGRAGGARLRCRRCGGIIEVRNSTAIDRKQTAEPPPAESRPVPPALT